MAQRIKHLPAVRETQVRSLGWEDPLEKEMATHSSILAWRIPWIERSLVGYSPQGRKELDMTEQLHSLSFTLERLGGLTTFTQVELEFKLCDSRACDWKL